MVFDQPNPARRSLGSLRKAEKTKDRSPDFTGTMKMQRNTFERVATQFKETDADEKDCCLASWRNVDANAAAPEAIRLRDRRSHLPNSSAYDLMDILHQSDRDYWMGAC
jgi:hypothetical protein